MEKTKTYYRNSIKHYLLLICVFSSILAIGQINNDTIAQIQFKNNTNSTIKGICSINGKTVIIPTTEAYNTSTKTSITIPKTPHLRLSIKIDGFTYKIEPVDFPYQSGNKKDFTAGINTLIISLKEDDETSEKFIKATLE